MGRHCYPIGCVIKSTHGAYVVAAQWLTFLKLHFIMEWLLSHISHKKNNLNRHIKHENLLSIYENMDYFQIMLFTATCWKFQKIQQPYIKRYCYVFFSTNIVEILLKLRADASSGSGAFKAFLQGSSSPSPSPSSSLLFSIFVQRPKDLDNHNDTHFHKGFQAHWMWTLFKRSCRFSWA